MGLSADEWTFAVLVASLVMLVAIFAALTYGLVTAGRASDVAGDGGGGGADLNPLIRLLHSEPALVAGVVSAAAALGAAFGLSLDAEQTGAIVAFISIILGLWVRSTVYAPATIAKSGLAYDESDGQLKRRVR